MLLLYSPEFDYIPLIEALNVVPGNEDEGEPPNPDPLNTKLNVDPLSSNVNDER
jgi:hypothetical protein